MNLTSLWQFYEIGNISVLNCSSGKYKGAPDMHTGKDEKS